MQVHGEDAGLYIERQFVEDLQVLVGFKSLISVVAPMVIKEILDVLHNLRFELFVVIELLHDPKELGEVVAVIERLV